MPVSTTKQRDTTSSNRVGTSTASATASSLPTKMSSSGTTTTLWKTDEEETNKHTTQEGGLSAIAIGLIVAVVVVSAVIFAIAGHMLKQKISKKKDSENSTLDTSIEDDVNIYPDSKKTMDPTDLFKFDLPAEKFSRPPSATSTRMLPPHQDFRKMYDHLDQLFAAK